MAMRQNASTGELVEDTSLPSKTPAARKDEGQLRVKVWSPFKVFYDAGANTVSGVNDTGAFDILPHHRNFITLLRPSDLVLQGKDGETRIKISGGVMQVHADTVTVFLEV